MGETRPQGLISPYSPSHRGFLNTWHCAGAARGAQGTDGDLVDYATAIPAAAQTLRDQYAAFCTLPKAHPEARAFAAFVKDAGHPLREFALFEALAAEFGADWCDWPALYRTHDAAALSAFEASHADVLAFTSWTQWQAHEQLARAQATAVQAGMRVGLYLDLAVGPRLWGAETWGQGSALVTGASLGAPPDPFGPLGQSWGLAPLCPVACRQQGYAGFARLLRANMQYAGMIRIDHVLGLMRSYWIPQGSEEGAYVSYPFDALLAVIAIESVRTDTIVVGEDLGLVPDGLRDKLADSGLYGLDVLQFMRDPDGGFVDTRMTRPLAVCSFATHDTPTIAGFFASHDAETRHHLGGLTASDLKKTKADRARAKASLRTTDPVQAIHRHLSRAKADMVAVQLDDIAGRTAQQNLPGTVDTYPNWRLKAPFTTQQIASSYAFSDLSQMMRAEGRSNPKSMDTQDDLQDSSNPSH